MSQPPMTEDQRIVVVGLLANALRKETTLRRQAEDAEHAGSLFAASAARARHTAASLHVRGMLDVIAVLFDGGRRTADACLEAARHLAGGPSSLTND
jgi:hypothetical protein